MNEDYEIKDIVNFSKFWFDFHPYKYQERFLNKCMDKKRIAGKWCRQSGKSHSVAVYTLFKAITKSNISIIIVAPTQNQSKELYSKIRDMAIGNEYINKYIKKSTETEMKFNNLSRIVSLPSGPYGATIRGYTADIVIIEEAGEMKDEIINSVIIPMLAAKGTEGQIIKIGTPLTRNHFYRSCFEDPEYTVINVKWQDCVKEGQYSRKFIDEQKKELTDIEFRSEYEAEFVDDIASFFPSHLIESCKISYPMINFV